MAGTDIAIPAPNEVEIDDPVDENQDPTPEAAQTNADDHVPNDFDRQCAPDSSENKGPKFSFDFDTNFPSFQELSQGPSACLTAEYNNPNDYFTTMINCVHEEATESQKILSEYSRHFTCLDVTMEKPLLATGKIEYQGYLGRNIHPSQLFEIRILELSPRGNYVETAAVSRASLVGYTPNKSATSFVDGINFRVNKAPRPLDVNVEDADDDYDDGDDDDEDEQSSRALQKFYELVNKNPNFKANIVWLCDDTVFRRMNNCLASLKLLYMKDSNSASWHLRDTDVHSETHMPLMALNPTGPQLSEPIRDIIIHGRPRDPLISYINKVRNRPGVDAMLVNLNESQKRAVQMSENNFVSIIQGPPGTGKTSTATSIIRRAFAAGDKVLITAPSNTAVDNIIRALLASIPRESEEHAQVRQNIIRLCSRGKYYKPDQNIEQYTSQSIALEPENLYDSAVSPVNHRALIQAKFLRQPNQLTRKLDKKEDRNADTQFFRLQKAVVRQKMRLVFTTCNGAADTRLKGTYFQLVIIDEAAQDIEPSTLIPFLRLHISGRVTLLGDHCQLGPCLMSETAQKLGFSLTLFERLLNMNVHYVMLDVQYRMHSEIGQLVSELMYHGKLQNGVPDSERTFNQLTQQHPSKMCRKPYIWIHVPAREGYTEMNKSTENAQEAVAVVDLAARCILVDGLKGNQIVIITSYSAQVNRLRATIQEAIQHFKERPILLQELPKVRIGTVDGFQGQESEVVIYSVVRSNAFLTVGFLENAKRLNVAISRARCLLYIVGNATMFPAEKVAHRRGGNRSDAGACLITRDQAHISGLKNWRLLLEKCMRNECIFVRSPDCWTLQSYRLPHEKQWPCFLSGVPQDEEILKVVTSSAMTLTITIRDHLLIEFKMTCMQPLRAMGCRIYCSPQSNNVTGWSEITISMLPSSQHTLSANSIRRTIGNFERFRIETRQCFLNPNVQNRGEHCREWKLTLLKDQYAVPQHMEQLHYRDPDYGVTNGIQKKGQHRVLRHLHIRHDIWRILVGELQKPDYDIYNKLRAQEIRLITEDGTLADTFEYMCGILVTTRGYNPALHWSLEKAFDEIVTALRRVLTNWASWTRNQWSRREADRRVALARQNGINVPLDIFH